MDTTTQHTLDQLFQQLGLPNDEHAIGHFIALHRPLPETIKLSEAPFWNQGQKDFLKQSLTTDADWAEVVDQLNTSLR